MINVQNSKDSRRNDITSQNGRYQDFLKFALNRIIETAHHYESQAKISHYQANKQFLYFLAGKKRVQHVILEIVACKNTNPEKDTSYSSVNEKTVEFTSLADVKPELIVKYAHERAEKDVNLYTSLAALEEDIHTRKLLLTLSKMSKDFMLDITAGYSKFTQQTSSPFFSTQTNLSLFIKSREETPVR
ncbi:MAG TPA: hypothetical protein VHO70_10565 [Chitinispirillaceae bacterium]|nr:hypothetical protein [Chitinispirillaceae bacterium]